MALYKNSVKQTLLDAIKAENPAFAAATLNNVVFGPPVNTGGTPNTSVVVRGIPGAGFTGIAKVLYNRISAPALIRNLPNLAVQQYTVSKTADLLPRVNQLYGLNITAEDISTANNIIPASNNSGLLQLLFTPSLQYVGSINLSWTRGSSPQLWELYPNTTLTSLTVPDLMLKAFQVDYSANKAVIEAVATNTPLTTDVAGAQALVNLIATSTGKAATLGATAVPGTGDYDLSGFTLTRVTQDQLTDSNPSYRQVAVLTPPTVFGKQYSTIYLHYDKIVVTPTTDIITVTELDGLVLPT